MSRREHRFYVLLAVALLVVAAIAVTRTLVDAVASPITPRPIMIALDDRAQLERARRYNRRLEKIVYREVSRAERHERTLARERQATRKALGTSPLGGHWLERAFLCIHEHEGSWRDQGLPYFGGLQMDLDFQRAYGRDFLRHFGTADQWPQSVQLAVAIRGYISRGFQPWPNTRKRCGL